VSQWVQQTGKVNEVGCLPNPTSSKIHRGYHLSVYGTILGSSHTFSQEIQIVTQTTNRAIDTKILNAISADSLGTSHGIVQLTSAPIVESPASDINPTHAQIRVWIILMIAIELVWLSFLI